MSKSITIKSYTTDSSRTMSNYADTFSNWDRSLIIYADSGSATYDVEGQAQFDIEFPVNIYGTFYSGALFNNSYNTSGYATNHLTQQH